LRKLEFDFADLKKLINLNNGAGFSSNSPSKNELANDVIQIEKLIKGFKEEKIYFIRVLGQDL
jgi:hypothetical protein